MGTDGDQSGSGRRGGRRLSRRKFLSGSVLAVGACSQFVTSRTVGAFRDDEATGGDVQVATLDIAVQDQSELWEAVRYLISYRVEMADGYDGIEVTVYNTSEGAVAETYSKTAEDGTEGVLEFAPENAQFSDEFEFTFEVLASGPDVSNPVLTDSIRHSPGEDEPSDGGLGGEDAPTIQQFTVADDSSDEDDLVQYEVSYQVENVGDFEGEVRVVFQSIHTVFGDEIPGTRETRNNTSVTSGSVPYSTEQSVFSPLETFDITVEVVKTNGIVVDSVTVSDEPDGTDTTWPE